MFSFFVYSSIRSTQSSPFSPGNLQIPPATHSELPIEEEKTKDSERNSGEKVEKIDDVRGSDAKQSAFPSSPRGACGKWKQNGITIAGGNGDGNQLNQLSNPRGTYVDDDHQCVYIADFGNHRIVKWKYGAHIGQVVAGGNGRGNEMNQLNCPIDVIADYKTDSLIICDEDNKRVVRWPRQYSTIGEAIIENVYCRGLAMDDNGYLYVSDRMKDEVRRWKIGEKEGTLVAGGNEMGDQLNQLNFPFYIFVDREYSVYVSDWSNHRVMK